MTDTAGRLWDQSNSGAMVSRRIIPIVICVCFSLSAQGAAHGESRFLRGDANDDGNITLADAIYLAHYLFEKGPVPMPDVNSGDADCNARVDMIDIVYLVNHLMRGGPEPRCPTL